MQKHIINTYTIDEHPEPEACIEYARNHWHDLYCWQSENADSLHAFCDHFGLTSPYWEVSLCGPSYASASVRDEIAQMSGVRLWKYLHNSGLLTYHKPDATDYRKNAALVAGECPFTGYTFDESLLDPIRAFVARPDARTYQELIDDCLAAWVSAYIEDWEYSYSDESIRDHLKANEYQFTESGEFYA